MKRRDAIKGSAAVFTLLGTIPGLVLNTSCSSDDLPAWSAVSFDELQGKTLRAAIDVLIPRSAAPSATDVNVHQLIDDIVSVNYSDERKSTFISAIDRLNSLASAEKGSDFHALSVEDQNTVMHKFVEDAEGQEKPGQLYGALKRQTLNSYFRTEEVCTKVLRHVGIPGKYESCIPLEEGQPLWAE